MLYLTIGQWTIQVGENAVAISFPAGEALVNIGITRAAQSGDFAVNATVDNKQVISEVVSIKKFLGNKNV